MRSARLALLLSALLAGNAWSLQRYEVRVLDRHPQPRDHFVQGLEFAGEHLYVSTGQYGSSRLMRYDFAAGRLLDKKRLERRIFAEGLTVLDNRVYQLTWRNRAMLVYDRDSLSLLGAWPLPGEGWGMANDGERLVYSDGSDRLHFVSATDGRLLHSIAVTEAGRPLHNLNELEWIDGRIWANVWRTERIVIIDPQSGEVTASVDLAGLLPAAERRRDTGVLNGIAKNPRDGAIWVTGKNWPWLYRIELTETGQGPPKTPDSR